MKKLRLTEALQALQELDYVPGVSMVVPDFNYTSSQRNFKALQEPSAWPYDPESEQGPANATGDTGQQGVGRGGVGMGGRSDVSGGVRQPSAAYTSTWQQDEGADWDESQRHGEDKLRNVWRDTPDGKQWTELNNEAMGQPSQIGPVAPMDGPQHNVLHFSSGSDELPDDDNRGPGNMWGGPSTIPGQSRGWAASPSLNDDPNDPWRVPEEKTMKLHEFFDPKPVPVEEIDNPAQDHLEDQGDEELEIEPAEPTPSQEPESTIATMVAGPDLMMGPDQVGMARGRYGLQTNGGSEELVDKKSAWDVLQKVVDALGQGILGEDS